MLEEQRVKAEAIFEFSGLQGGPAGKMVLRLLDLLIEEVRRENDTVPPGEVLRNQGKIAAWTQMRDYLVRGIPAR